MLGTIKQASISLGLYKTARTLHRSFFRSERRHFLTNRALYAQFVRPGDLVFDVGANIGARTEIFLSLGAAVVAFEPQPKCAREIKARGNSKLVVVEKALGSDGGFAELHLKTVTTSASLLPDWQGEKVGVLKVPVTTLDSAIKEFGQPSFCKIDVEGFELEVLKGLSTSIDTISIEYQCDHRGIEKIRACFGELSRMGELSVNITGQEDNKLLLPRWLPSWEFVKGFPACAGPNFYGDVFVRMNHSFAT
jgi:FkbM family methyltransferase